MDINQIGSIASIIGLIISIISLIVSSSILIKVTNVIKSEKNEKLSQNAVGKNNNQNITKS